MFLLILSLASLAIILIREKYRFWTKRNVVQDCAYPFFGISWGSTIRKYSIAEVFQHLYNKFPQCRYVGVYDYTTPVLLIKNPELLKQISIKDFEHFRDHRPKLPKNIDPLWNRNLFNLVGSEWKEMRTTLSPNQTGSRMRGMFDLMEQCAKKFVQYFVQHNQDIVEIDAREALTRFTNDVIASTAYGFECDSLKEKNNDFYMKGMQITDLSGVWKFIRFDILRAFPWLSTIIKVGLFDDEITKFFRAIIKDNVEYRLKKEIDRPDLISLLMNAKKRLPKSGNVDAVTNLATVNEDNSGPQKKTLDFTMDDIAAQALIFFFSGFGTVSSVLTFLIYELAVNPDIQNKLIEEMDNFRSKNEKLTYEGLFRLSYLDMTVSELLRKWPSFIRTDRVCTKSYTIVPETPDENPVSIPKGQIVWIPIYSIHHDEKYWPHPEKFDPERFSAKNKMNIIPGTYLPFGIGPRTCIASRFVLQEIKIFMYEILSTFEIVTTEKTIIPCQPYKNSSALLPGDGFWFGLKLRKKST